MLSRLYLGAGFCLAFTGGAVFVYQLFAWLRFGEWPPAPLGILWELVGIDGPRAGLPLPGVFLILGAWHTWEGVKRKPPKA